MSASPRLASFVMKPKPVPLDNGETVYIRRFSGAEHLEWMEFLDGLDDKQTTVRKNLAVSLRLLTLTLSDEGGKRLFLEEIKPNDIDAAYIHFLANEALAYNNLGSSSGPKSEGGSAAD